MMKTSLLPGLVCAVLAAAAPSAGAADAAQAEALAKKYNCLQCHSADKKILWPSYKDVAAKYKGNKNAQALLVKNVKAGSKGTWGQIPMPPNDKVSDAKAATLVRWILSQWEPESVRDERVAGRALTRHPDSLPHPLVLLLLVCAMFGVMYAVSAAAAEPAPRRAAQLA